MFHPFYVMDRVRMAALIHFLLILLTVISLGAQAAMPEKESAVPNMDLTFVDYNFNELTFGTWSIVKGPKGYTWFSNHGGLYRYDGVQLLKILDRQGPILKGRRSGRMVAKLGALWISTKKGLLRFDLSSYQTKEYNHSKDNASSLPSGLVFRYSSHNLARLWLASRTGVAYYAPETDSFVRFQIPESSSIVNSELGESDKSNNNKMGRVSRVAEDNDGVAWVATWYQGLHFIMPGSDKPILASDYFYSKGQSTLGAYFSSTNVSDVFRTKNGSIIVSAPGRFLEFNNRNTLVHSIAIPDSDKRKSGSFNGSQINEDAYGNIWMVSSTSGIIRVDKNRKGLRYQNNNRGVGASMSADTVVASSLDDDGMLTLIYNRRKPQRSQVLTQEIDAFPIEVNNKILAKSYYELRRLGESKYALMAGTSLLLFDRKTHIFTELVDDIEKFSVLRSTVVDALGRLWLATAKGLYRLNLEKSVSNLRPQFEKILDGNFYRVLLFDGTLIARSWGNHHYLNPETLQELDTKQVKDVLVGANKIFLAPDRGMYLVVGSKILYSSAELEQPYAISLDTNVGEKLSDYLTFKVVGNKLWMLGDGVAVADLSGSKGDLQLSNMTKITAFDGEKLSLLTPGLNGELWIQAQHALSIYRYIPAQDKVSKFDFYNGFPEQPLTSNLVIDDSGAMSVPTKGKLYTLKTPNQYLPPVPEPLKIRSTAILQKNHEYKIDYGTLSDIVMDYTDTSININFSDNSFSAKHLLGVQFQLRGRDTAWLDAEVNFAKYSGLLPGDYVFELRKKNQLFISDTLTIRVKAPWWQSFWAYVGYFLSLTLVLSLLIFLRWDKLKSIRESSNQLKLYAKGFENAIEGFCVVNQKVEVKVTNASFRRMTTFNVDTDLLSLKQLCLESFDCKPTHMIWVSLQKEKSWSGRLWLLKTDGVRVPLECNAALVEQEGETEELYMLVVNDITQKMAHEEDLLKLANYDTLTELPNRNYINAHINQLLNLAAKKNRKDEIQFSVLFVDVDRFKYVNDSMSHHYGDKLLLALAARFIEVTGPDDTVARIGGDEFVIVVNGGREQGSQLAKRLIRSLDKPIKVAEREIFSSVSIGGAMYPHDGGDIDSIFSRSDIAMYSVKADGGNGVKFYDKKMNDESMFFLQMESSIRRALNDYDFEVHFQAKVSMISREVVGFEALARWPKADGRFIGPDQFIPVAERTGLIIPLSMQILEKVCQALVAWQRSSEEVYPVAFNVCARQLMTNEFSIALEAMLTQYGIEPKLLELEITESSLLEGIDQVIVQLKDFRRRGHKISIDDFGTGYSSMSYLTQLPLDVLKIDRSFIIGLHDDVGKQAVINTMLELAKNLGLETVAEGIEDMATHEYLKVRGCVMGQGYLYAKPMSVHDIDRSKLLLRRSSPSMSF